jgi:hypothetical protein
MDIAPRDRLVTLPEGVPELTLGWEAIHWATKYLLASSSLMARTLGSAGNSLNRKCGSFCGGTP